MLKDVVVLFLSLSLVTCLDDKSRKTYESYLMQGSAAPCSSLSCDAQPPVFVNCPSSMTVYSDRGSEFATNVTWPQVTAVDPPTGRPAKVVMNSTTFWRTFYRGEHQIIYQAYDQAGNRAITPCTFMITVETIRCHAPNLHPDSSLMLYECTKYIYGTVCSVSCQFGYTLGGPKYIVCEKDNSFPPVASWKWDETSGIKPHCIVKTCPNLTPPAHGALSCEETAHGRICQMQCKANYSVPPAAPPDAMYLCSTADGTWRPNSSVPDCVRDKPPVFYRCPLNMTLISDRGLNYTNATWLKPIAIDPATRRLAKVIMVSSEPWGTYFEEGEHRVVYQAKNDAGFKAVSPCTFTVTVKTLRCPVPNLHPNDALHLMQYGCKESIYGTVCPVSCQSGHPLKGPDHIVCEKDNSFPPVAFWKWNETIGIKPHCIVKPCPNLKAPANGALACDTWMNGQVCQMQCNDRYYFPDKAPNDGVFLCGSATGRWHPTAQVPDCDRLGHRPSLSENRYHFFYGNCSTERYDIKRNFIMNVQNSLLGSDACLNVPACKSANVRVTCPDTTPPVFVNCPRNITHMHFSDRGLNYTNVTWDTVTAIDNQGRPANVTLVSPKPWGTYFEEGEHDVVYQATDESGNQADTPCSFKITVETIRCPTPNLYPNDTLQLMQYGCKEYIFGTVCPVSCQSGHSLNGPDHIVCEKDDSFPPKASWKWNEASGIAPWCIVKPCANLTAPAHGALACDKWMHGRMCQMQCQRNYNFPVTAPADGMFVCGTATGHWRPERVVPDCVAYAGFTTMRMKAYFYFNGSYPGNPGVEQQIKQNFITAVKNSLYGYEVCTNIKACNAENVEVISGKVTRDVQG